MKKKFKDTKVGKILKGLLGGVVDVLPGGSTIKTVVEGVLTKKLDRNNDKKITIDDFKPAELVGLFVGLGGLAYLASKGIIDVEILKQVAEIFGL